MLGEQNGEEGVCRNWPNSGSTEPWCLVKGAPTPCNVPSCGKSSLVPENTRP